MQYRDRVSIVLSYIFGDKWDGPTVEAGPPWTGRTAAALGQPVKDSGAEAAAGHEAGRGEIDQVGHDRCPLAKVEVHDHRTTPMGFLQGA